jgi:hypothetical protein
MSPGRSLEDEHRPGHEDHADGDDALGLDRVRRGGGGKRRVP